MATNETLDSGFRNPTSEEKNSARKLLEGFAVNLNPDTALALKTFIKTKKLILTEFKFGISPNPTVAKVLPIINKVMDTEIPVAQSSVPKIIRLINEGKLPQAEQLIHSCDAVWGDNAKKIGSFFRGIIALKKENINALERVSTATARA